MKQSQKIEISYSRFKRMLFDLNDSTALEAIFDKETWNPWDELIKVNYVKKDDLSEHEFKCMLNKNHIRIHSDDEIESMWENNSKWYQRHELDWTYYDILINNALLYKEFILKFIIDNFQWWKNQAMNLSKFSENDFPIYIEFIGLREVLSTFKTKDVVWLVKEYNSKLLDWVVVEYFLLDDRKWVIRTFGYNPYYMLIDRNKNNYEDDDVDVEKKLLQLYTYIIEYLNDEYDNMINESSYWWRYNTDTKKFLEQYIKTNPAKHLFEAEYF